MVDALIIAGVAAADLGVADPDHAMLGGKDGHGGEGIEFIAAGRGADGETGGNFVFPGLIEPAVANFINECFKWSGHRSHVSGAAEDNSLGRTWRVCQSASVSIVTSRRTASTPSHINTPSQTASASFLV